MPKESVSLDKIDTLVKEAALASDSQGKEKSMDVPLERVSARPRRRRCGWRTGWRSGSAWLSGSGPAPANSTAASTARRSGARRSGRPAAA